MKRENLQIAGLLLGLCVFGPELTSAQTAIDMRTQSKNIDFSGALSTRPVKTGAALPPVCSQGDLFFKTTAPAGQNLYGCAAANTWVALSGGGGGVAMPVRIWLPAAGCSGSTASTGWDLPSSDAMTAACLTGANTNKGVGTVPRRNGCGVGADDGVNSRGMDRRRECTLSLADDRDRGRRCLANRNGVLRPRRI